MSDDHYIDIRVFKRYPREVSFVLEIDGRSCPARTTDYSLNSLGIIVEAAGIINPGDVLALDVPALDICQHGQVVWAKREGSTLRAGLAKLGILRGSFSNYHLSDILIGFQRTLMTGILDIVAGSVRKKVYISNGNIIFSTSDQDEDRLGDILLKEGKMTRSQYDGISERKAIANERYVSILVSERLLDPSELLWAIELQATRIIEGLFSMPEAHFMFIEGPLPLDIPVTLKLSVADLIYREVRKGADPVILKRYLPDNIVDFSSTPLNLFQNIRLDAADRRLLSYIDGKTSIRELIRVYSLVEEEALRSLFALLEARIIEIKRVGADPTGIAPEGICCGLDENYCELIDRIDERYSLLKKLDYYGLLGVTKEASPEDLKKAYFRAARQFHPDMHVGLPSDIKEKLVTISSCINNAYLTLKDYRKRSEYDSSVGAGTADSAKCAETKPRTEASGDSATKGSGQAAQASSDSSMNSQTAKVRYEEGKVRFKEGKTEEAAHSFASAIYFDGSCPEYHYFYGRSLARLGKFKEAMQSLYRSSELAPNSADTLAEIGHIYLKLNCIARARGNFERALKIQSSNARAKEGLEIVRQESEEENKK